MAEMISTTIGFFWGEESRCGFYFDEGQGPGVRLLHLVVGLRWLRECSSLGV